MAKEKPKKNNINGSNGKYTPSEETARKIAGSPTENAPTTILDFFPEWEEYLRIMAILSETEEVAQTAPVAPRPRTASILAKVDQLATDFGADWKKAILEGLHPKAEDEDFEEWVEAFVAWQGFSRSENTGRNALTPNERKIFKIITALKYCITNRNLGKLDLFLDVESANFQQEPNGQTEGAYFLEQIGKRLPLERIAHYKKNNENGALELFFNQSTYTTQQKADIKKANYKELLNFDSLDNFLTAKQEERNKKRTVRRLPS